MSTEQKPGKARRLLRIMLWIGGPLLLLVLALPLLLSAILPGVTESQLEKRLNVEAELDEFSVGYGGGVRLGGLQLSDLAGRSLASIRQMTAAAELLPALSGRYRTRVALDGLELHVRPGQEARLNLMEVVRARQEQTDSETPAGNPPDLATEFSLKNSRVIVHGEQGDTILEELSFQLTVKNLREAAPFGFSTRVVGPDGAAGSVSGTGEIVPLPADGSSGSRLDMTLDVERLLLEALQPAITLFAPGKTVAGILTAHTDVRVDVANQVQGNGLVELESLEVGGLRPDAPPLRLASVTLDGSTGSEAGIVGAGPLSHRLELKVEEFLEVVLEGNADDRLERLAGTLRIDASLPRLMELAGEFLPVTEGLAFGGSWNSNMEYDLGLDGDGLASVSLNATSALNGLSATDASGQPVDLGELGDSRFELQANADLRAGSLAVDRLFADLGPLTADGSAGLSGLPTAGPEQTLNVRESSFQIDADLDRLVARLQPLVDLTGLDLAGSVKTRLEARQQGESIHLESRITPSGLRVKGIGLDGTPLDLVSDLRAGGGRIELLGHLSTSNLALTLAGDRTVRQQDVRIDLDVAGDPAALLELRTARYSSATSSAEITGTLFDLPSPETRSADLVVTLSAGLEQLLAEIAPLLGDNPPVVRGRLDSRMTVKSLGRDVTIQSMTRADDLYLRVTSDKEGAAPLVLEEPKLTLALDGALTGESGNLDLRKMDLDSRLLRGGLTGQVLGLLPEPKDLLLQDLKGEFFYVPDRINSLLAPWLPGELIGAEEQKVDIAFSGRLEELDPISLLQSSRADLNASLGRFKLKGLETDGTLKLDLDQGRANLTGDLGANGGSLDLLGDLGGPTGSGSRNASLKMSVKDFQLNADLGSVLAMAHPIFASAAGGPKANSLAGLIQCEIDLGYGEPVTLERLASDWRSLDPKLLKGTIDFQMADAVIRGSPLFDQLLDVAGLTSDKELKVEPVHLSLDGGRLFYAEPWKWKLGGVKTAFTGSVGLDQSLDLKWNIPVNNRLVGKHDFLKPLLGESLEIPLTGTTSMPNLQWQGIFSQLASKAAQKTIREETGGLGGLLGVGGSDDSPDDLLAQADALWKEKKRRDAAKIYRRLEKEFKFTPVFLLNKKRIEKRAEFKN